MGRPIMPDAAEKMAVALGLGDALQKATLPEAGKWGGSEVGTAISSPKQLFPRMEKKKEQPKQAQPEQSKKGKKIKEQQITEDGLVTFDQFGKFELRVAEITAADTIPKADRLLKLTVLAPEERTIVAGIAEHYSPEELIGKQVIIVANLKPAKLRGVLSQGMVLAAKEKLEDGTEK